MRYHRLSLAERMTVPIYSSDTSSDFLGGHGVAKRPIPYRTEHSLPRKMGPYASYRTMPQNLYGTIPYGETAQATLSIPWPARPRLITQRRAASTLSTPCHSSSANIFLDTEQSHKQYLAIHKNPAPHAAARGSSSRKPTRYIFIYIYIYI